VKNREIASFLAMTCCSVSSLRGTKQSYHSLIVLCLMLRIWV